MKSSEEEDEREACLHLRYCFQRQRAAGILPPVDWVSDEDDSSDSDDEDQLGSPICVMPSTPWGEKRFPAEPDDEDSVDRGYLDGSSCFT